MMLRKRALSAGTCLATTLLLFTAAPVMAQDDGHSADANAAPADANADSGAPEIVVTAQFTAQRLQDTPLSISAINADTMAQRGLGDVVQAAAQVPNVTLTTGNSVGGGAFGQFTSAFIRGVGQSDINFAVEPGVGLYIDDVYYGVMSGSLLQLIDLDRIEVLRGPQGTLSGKNSIGGSIKIFSKRPGPQNDGYAELTYGSRNLLKGRAASNFTIIDGKLYARLSIAGTRQNGYLKRLDYACATGDYSGGTHRINKDCVIGTQGGTEFLSGRLSLRWDDGGRFTDSLILDGDYDNSEDPAVKLFSQGAIWAGSNNYITGPKAYTNYEDYVVRPTGPLSGPNSYQLSSRSPLTSKGVTNTAKFEISDTVSLTSITGYRTSDVHLSSAEDAAPVSITDQAWRLKHKQFTEELRLSGKVHDFLEWTLGGYHYKASGVQSGRVTLPGAFALGGGGVDLDTVFHDPVKAYSDSLFAHTIWHPVHDADLIAGIRYTKDGKDFTFNRYNWQGLPHPALSSLVDKTGSYRGEHVDYRLGVAYHWTADIMTYAQFSTGFKGGGINPRPYFGSQAVAFDPETLKAYEVGFKAQFFDRAVTLNGAGFINKYRNIQGNVNECDDISPFPNAPCAATRNFGDATIKGLELETVIEPIQGLNFNASMGYLDFQYTRTNAASGITLDMKPAYVPSFNLSAGLQYRIDADGIGSITPRMDLTYKSDIETTAINRPDSVIKGFALLNAGITWQNADDDWSVQLRVSNLLDKFYYISKTYPDAPSFLGVGQVAPPREWSVTVKRNF